MVLLDREHRSAAAVRDAGGDHERVALVELEMLVLEFLVQHLERELDRAQHVLAPVLFRVLLRVRVLEGEAVRRGRVEGRALAGLDVRREVRIVARCGRISALAAHQVHGVGLQIVRAGAGALVGIGDGAAALEAPLAGGRDRPVDAARTGRGRGNDAGIRRDERVRDLHHHGDVALATAALLVGDVFVAGDLSFACRDGAVRRHVRSVERAVAAARRRVDQRAIVVVDREPAQFLRSRIQRVDESRRQRDCRVPSCRALR